MEYIQLNNGIKMPSIGFGVYQIPLLMTKQCVLDALAIGYRHIDTARNYGNEGRWLGRSCGYARFAGRNGCGLGTLL